MMGTENEPREAAPAQLPRDPESYAYDGAPPPAEIVHARVAAAAVLPSALAVACEAHDAPVGVRCFDAGVCGDRMRRRVSGLAS